ncbi:MAG: aldose epimerase family protein [Shimia sp.]
MSFGTTSAGEPVERIELGTGPLRCAVLSYGAVLQDVRLKGVPDGLTLGSPDLAAYEGPLESAGALMGPVVNRIRSAQAEIAGRTYRFEANFEGRHTLHSGAAGTHRKVWRVWERDRDHLRLALSLPDGEGGFPGQREITVDYSVQNATLRMEITATTDAPTILNLANHSYWRLGPGPTFAGHRLHVVADSYLEPDAELMPTGRRLPVAGTAYDARERLMLAGEDTQFFDLNYCLAEEPQPLRPVATLTGEWAKLELATTAPGLQVYDMGTVDSGGFATTWGGPVGHYAGLALEAQHWPGATTHAQFPSIEVHPGEIWRQTTEWRFTA